MTNIQAIILGIIQGITEFLPISSDGHLELFKHLLHTEATQNLTFDIVLHGATVLSILVVFYKDIIALLKNFFKNPLPSANETSHYTWLLLISMIPVGIVGVFFKHWVESFFDGNIKTVGIFLIINGFILFLTRLQPAQARTNFTVTDALLIGVAQAVAVMPGISRSACTVSAALLRGIDKKQAVKFSFLMVIIPILGANVLELKDAMEYSNTVKNITTEPITPYILGAITAFFTGVFACNLLIKIVQKGKIAYFSIYCFVVGLLAIWGS